MTYIIKSCLVTGEGEGEAGGKMSVLHPHVVQEVANTLSYMIKQLETHRETKYIRHIILLCD